MSKMTAYRCLSLLGVLGGLGGCGVIAPEATENIRQLQSEAVVSSISEGDYVIRSVATNKCIDVDAASTADGAKVQQWDCNGSNAQKFHISPTSDGYWKIINVNSNKGLDVAENSTAQNAKIHQWSYVGGNNQQFKFVSRGNNQFSIHLRHTDMAVDLYWGSANNGTEFVQYPYNGTANQLYTFDKLGGGDTGGGSGRGCLAANDGQTSLRFINKCAFDIDFAGNNITGGSLARGQEACRTIGSVTTTMLAKRYWGFRKGEDPGFERHSLAEFGFNEVFYSYTSWDWFNLSHVDAHNLPLKIVPYDLAGGTTCSGQIRSCPQNLLTNCPAVGQLRNGAGQIISCWSPDRDNPNSVIARYFDAGCSQSYSWSGDDAGPMAACNAEDFDIVFCPES